MSLSLLLDIPLVAVFQKCLKSPQIVNLLRLICDPALDENWNSSMKKVQKMYSH